MDPVSLAGVILSVALIAAIRSFTFWWDSRQRRVKQERLRSLVAAQDPVVRLVEGLNFRAEACRTLLCCARCHMPCCVLQSAHYAESKFGSCS
jgi:hypothetical protein